jgi:hypothetical protein
VRDAFVRSARPPRALPPDDRPRHSLLQIWQSAGCAKGTEGSERQVAGNQQRMVGSPMAEAERMVIPAPRSTRRAIGERRVADGGEQRIIDRLEDFLTE